MRPDLGPSGDHFRLIGGSFRNRGGDHVRVIGDIFESTGYNNDWDGNYNGNLNGGSNTNLPVGTYFYVLDLNGDGSRIKKGYIYLTRMNDE